MTALPPIPNLLVFSSTVKSAARAKYDADQKILMNALTVIIGNAQLVLRELTREDFVESPKPRALVLLIIQNGWLAVDAAQSSSIMSDGDNQDVPC